MRNSEKNECRIQGNSQAPPPMGTRTSPSPCARGRGIAGARVVRPSVVRPACGPGLLMRRCGTLRRALHAHTAHPFPEDCARAFLKRSKLRLLRGRKILGFRGGAHRFFLCARGVTGGARARTSSAARSARGACGAAGRLRRPAGACGALRSHA